MEKPKVKVSWPVSRWMTALYLGGIVLNLVIFFFMHLYRFGVEDVSAETMAVPLSVGCVQEAHCRGIPYLEFLAKEWRFTDAKREGPTTMVGIFTYEYVIYADPFGVSLYFPFIRMFGVGRAAVSAFACVWAFACLLVVFILARVMLGRWYDILSVLFLQSSVTWLIHAKIGCSQWFPSVSVIILLIFFVYYYWTARKMFPLIIGAGLVGVLCTEVWIGFFLGGLILVVSILLSWKSRRQLILLDLIMAFLAMVIAYFTFTFLYAAIMNIDVKNIGLTFYNSVVARFSQGGIPAYQPSLLGKLNYALKCLFLDSTQMDHDDKYLEGVPAISLLFAVFFFLGLVMACRRRTTPYLLVVVWLGLFFIVITFVYLFAHRYSLLFLPAMAILASVGVMESFQWLRCSRFKGLSMVVILFFVGCLLFTNFRSYTEYYDHYTLHKKPSFENDRMRGHAVVADWIKARFPAPDTLIVLNDHIMFCWGTYEFNLNIWQNPYHFLYWNNYINGSSSVMQVRQWVKDKLAQYRHVIFVFSPQLLGNPQTNTYFNDWRPFIAAYPQLKPSFSYSYDNRLLILVFEISRPPSE